MSFNATYLKANDPITKRALWIREQRIGARVWRWCVLTSPEWEVPRIMYSPPPTGEGQGEGEGQVQSPSPQPSPGGRGGLYWDDPGRPLRLMPPWMYWLPFQTKYESLHWNGRVSGTIIIPPLNARGGQGELPSDHNPSRPPLILGGGEEWTLTHWPAQQGHLWGQRIAKEWAWAHGNCFKEDHTAAFEMLTGGGRTLFNLRSQRFNLQVNEISTWRCTRHEIAPTHWNWEFAHDDLKIAGQFRLGYAPMVALDYPTPQGGFRTCHNTKVGEGVIEVVRAGRPLLQLTAHDSLAWEFVRP